MVAPINHPEGSNTLEYLPPEIITQILSHLPVKSLLKFKCVSKTWRSEISSSKFTKTHLNSSKYSKSYSNLSLILQLLKCAINFTYYTCSLSSILDKTAPLQPKVLYDPTSRPDDPLFMFGNCNGLLCVQGDHSTIVLHNPATRKLKRLPASGFERYPTTYALCYYEPDDDYRVVQLRTLGASTKNGVYGVNIYSLRTNSWRKINDIFDCSDSNEYIRLMPGVPVGGLLHWNIDSTRICNSYCRIFEVDTVTHTHETLAGPKYDHSPRVGEWGVMDFGGCLGAFQIFPHTGVHIWTMKESWSKVLSLNYCGVNNWSPTFPPVGLKNGEVLVETEPAYLTVYKPRENTLITKAIPNFYVSQSVGTPIYIESLVAPSFDDL